jgi:hypothetical protein
MSNAFYDLGRKAFLDGSINWMSDTIKAALVEGTYTPNLSTDHYYTDLGSNVAGTPVALASKTDTAGTADAADVTFSSVPAGPACSYVVLYKDTGTGSTSPLIAIFDTATTGLPVTPSGGDISVQWSGSGIFKL